VTVKRRKKPLPVNKYFQSKDYLPTFDNESLCWLFILAYCPTITNDSGMINSFCHNYPGPDLVSHYLTVILNKLPGYYHTG